MEDGRHGGRGVGLELSGRVGRVGTVGRAERAGRADGREGAVRAGRGSNPRVGAVEDRRGGRSCRLVYGVETALASLCPKVDRVYGDTRVDTSLELYRAGGSRWGDTAIVATGANYADALSVSSYAYHAKAPVFLCDPSTGLTAAQRTALNGFKHVLVVGGEAAVPSSYVAGLSDVVRLQGATRYETSVEIARWASSNGLHMDGAVFATGANFPDALAAGPLAGVNGGVVLLVDGPSSPAVSYATAYKAKSIVRTWWVARPPCHVRLRIRSPTDSVSDERSDNCYVRGRKR